MPQTEHKRLDARLRTCPECTQRTRAHGPAKRLGLWVDQVIVCPRCGWCGVQSWSVDEYDAPAAPAQLELWPCDVGC